MVAVVSGTCVVEEIRQITGSPVNARCPAGPALATPDVALEVLAPIGAPQQLDVRRIEERLSGRVEKMLNVERRFHRRQFD